MERLIVYVWAQGSILRAINQSLNSFDNASIVNIKIKTFCFYVNQYPKFGKNEILLNENQAENKKPTP